MSDPRATLSALIDASGLSISRFARDVVARDVRTVRRWLAGETIPDSVAQWIGRVSVRPISGKDTVAITVSGSPRRASAQ